MTNLHDRFWDVVRQEAFSANMTIAPGCEAELRKFIHQGVSKLTAGGLVPQTQEIDLTEQNLRTFVREMIALAHSSGMTELHENIFLDIRSKLCPIFPFC